MAVEARRDLTGGNLAQHRRFILLKLRSEPLLQTILFKWLLDFGKECAHAQDANGWQILAEARSNGTCEPRLPARRKALGNGWMHPGQEGRRWNS
jgi:hypothetical protein